MKHKCIPLKTPVLLQKWGSLTSKLHGFVKVMFSVHIQLCFISVISSYILTILLLKFIYKLIMCIKES